MLANATVSKLAELGLSMMAAGLAEQLEDPGRFAELSFCDRLGLLVDKEADARDSRRLKMRLRTAAMSKRDVLDYLPVEGFVGGAKSWDDLVKEWHTYKPDMNFKTFLQDVKNADFRFQHIAEVVKSMDVVPEDINNILVQAKRVLGLQL